MKMKYNTYLFDFDGTLVDSMPSFISVMLRILDENGIKYYIMLFIFTMVSMPSCLR